MEQKHGFALDIRRSTGKQRVLLDSRLSVGRAEDNDLVLDEPTIAPHLCIFKIQNDILSIHYLNGSTPFLLGPQSLEAGKMYIIDEGDKISIDDIEIIIRKEEAAGEIPAELQAIFAQEKEEVVEIEEEEEEEPQFEQMTVNEDHDGIDPDDKTDPNVKMPQFDALPDDLDEEDEFEEEAPKKKWWQFFSKKEVEFEVEDVHEHEDEEEEETHFEEEVDEDIEEQLTANNQEAPRPLAFAQFAAFIAQVGLSLTLFSFIGDNPIFTDLSNLMPKEAKDFIPASFVSLVFIYILIDVLSHLIFGTNLVLFLMGIKQSGSFISVRVKALFRSLISIVTVPTLVTELPILLGKRPLKEVITKSQLMRRTIVLEIVGMFVITPVCLFLPLAIPLIMDKDAFQVQPMKASVLKILKANKKKDLVKIDSSSKVLNLNYKAKLDQSRDLISPVTILKRKKILNISFFDRKNFQKITIEKLQPPPILNWLIWAQKGNPLFALTSPVLAQQHSSLTKGNKVKLGDKGLLELKQTLLYSLGLSQDNLLDIVLDQGPFLSGLINLQENLSRVFGAPLNMLNVNLYDQGKHLVLHVAHKKTLRNNRDQVYIIGKDSFERFQLKYTKKHKKYVRRFVKSYLVGIRPYQKPKKDEVKVYNSITILDFFNELLENSKYQLEDSEMAKIYEFYMSQARLVYNKKKEEKDFVAESITGAANYIETLNKSRKQILMSELKTGLVNIKKALIEENEDFFK